MGNAQRIALAVLPIAATLVLAAPAQTVELVPRATGPRPPRDLSEDQGVVLTVLSDRARRGDAPGTVEEIAAATAWPGARTYGVARTRRVLNELRRLGLARRIQTRADGVRWEAQR